MIKEFHTVEVTCDKCLRVEKIRGDRIAVIAHLRKEGWKINSATIFSSITRCPKCLEG